MAANDVQSRVMAALGRITTASSVGEAKHEAQLIMALLGEHYPGPRVARFSDEVAAGLERDAGQLGPDFRAVCQRGG